MRFRFRPDGFLLLLIGTMLVATLLPAKGQAAVWFDWLTTAGITLLFFLHGAKLSRQAIVQGIGAWRLHLMVLATTYGLFPLLGLGIASLFDGFVNAGIIAGLLFLCVVPSTVQSSIAMTAIARGNVAAAICSASLSNVVGIVLTPLLAGLLIGGQATTNGESFFLSALSSVALTLLLPFVVGHLARPMIGAFIDRHAAMVMRVDRGAILLVVYTAFSAAIVEGLWRRLSWGDMGIILLIDTVLLGVVLMLTRLAARASGFSREDEAVLLFCGSKKSLASGVPMAGAMFPPASVGLLILPLMLYHQMQLIVCTAIAQSYGRRAASATTVPERHQG